MKICFISDVHCQLHKVKLPEADILCISGDFTGRGTIGELAGFNNSLGAIKHKFGRIVGVFGNHDQLAERDFNLACSIIPNIEILHNSSLTIKGINFWGSPATPEFFNWSFNYKRGEEIAKIWSRIPEETDFLITHGPPFGILDLTDGSSIAIHAGCEDLLAAINARPNIKLSAFGHLHFEGSRYLYQNGKLFINASSCRNNYQPTNPPIVVEFDDVADVANYKITQYIE